MGVGECCVMDGSFEGNMVKRKQNKNHPSYSVSAYCNVLFPRKQAVSFNFNNMTFMLHLWSDLKRFARIIQETLNDKFKEATERTLEVLPWLRQL